MAETTHKRPIRVTRTDYVLAAVAAVTWLICTFGTLVYSAEPGHTAVETEQGRITMSRISTPSLESANGAAADVHARAGLRSIGSGSDRREGAAFSQVSRSSGSLIPLRNKRYSNERPTSR